MASVGSPVRVSPGATPSTARPAGASTTTVPRAPLPLPGKAHPLRPRAWSPDPDIQHSLDGLAGFYRCEADARTAVQQLGSKHGLQSSQLALLSPADAGWLRFTWLARRWNRRPHRSRIQRVGPLGAVGLFGALFGLMATLAWQEFDSSSSVGPGLLTLLAAAACGAAVAAGRAALLHGRQPQFIDFDRKVRNKLAHGSWAVLAHDLRWAQQTGAVALIRSQGGHWCAVSSARRRM